MVELTAPDFMFDFLFAFMIAFMIADRYNAQGNNTGVHMRMHRNEVNICQDIWN